MASVYPETKSFLFTFFSHITGREVVDSSGNVVGKLFDVVVVTSEIYPKAIEIVINRGFFKRSYAYVPWTALAEFNEQVRLTIKGTALKFSRLKEARAEISLRRDILDQQVVDTFNRRVVRVNDLHLLKVGLDLMVAHIDIGFKGLMRRLGFNRIADFLVKLIAPNSSYLKKENFISWKYVQILSLNPASSNLKVSVPYRQFSQIHPVELSEIIADLDPNQKLALFRALETETQAKVFVDIESETQKFLVQGMVIDELARLVAILPSDEAADFLDLVPKKMVEQLLARLETGRAKKLSTLLGYASDSAGGLMTTEFIAVPASLPVKEVLERVKESNLRSEMIYYVYIVDETNRLVGSTTLKRLLAAHPDDNVLATSQPKTAAVHLNDEVKEVAFLIEKYRLFALPVIDNDRILQGIITVDDILEQLLALIWRRRSRL
jgi:CBS domain-containing protein